ncbi:MAG: hypothetical protein IPM60_02175 [Rhodospirillales bacterium]|nr:hypothetical protein [Rhodospirillales bacterium]
MKIAVAVVLSSIIVAGCQQLAGILSEKPPPPGKKLVALPAEVWQEEQCSTRPLPYLRLDASGIEPKTINSGNTIRYRFSYTACVPPQPGYILGRFQTAIFYKDEKLSTRYDDGYPLETGKSIVDTEVKVPKGAEPGTYILRATLTADDVELADSVSFNVVP